MLATRTLILTTVFKTVLSDCGPRTPAHEAGGLYPYTCAAAKTLLRQVNYSDSCASSSVAVSLLVARAYSEVWNI